MVNPLVDRVSEQRSLRALLKRTGPSMAVLYGRRRVGKTYLLKHTWSAVRVFYFTAVDGTSELNRRALLEAVGRFSGHAINERDYATWRRVFELLLELGKPGPTVVILDEYQYLHGDPNENVDSALAAVWESYVNLRPKGLPFVLVLCGSIVRVMERLDAPDNPLHGRLDWKGHLDPFDYFDAAAMARFRSPRDRALAYGIYGGTPRYLASINTRRSLTANVVEAVLPSAGAVRGQVETIVTQEHGLRDTADYSAVLNAIGAGATDRNEIAQQTGLTNDFALRAKLDMLIELGFVTAWRNFDAKMNTPLRYRVTDPRCASITASSLDTATNWSAPSHCMFGRHTLCASWTRIWASFSSPSLSKPIRAYEVPRVLRRFENGGVGRGSTEIANRSRSSLAAQMGRC